MLFLLHLFEWLDFPVSLHIRNVIPNDLFFLRYAGYILSSYFIIYESKEVLNFFQSPAFEFAHFLYALSPKCRLRQFCYIVQPRCQDSLTGVGQCKN